MSEARAPLGIVFDLDGTLIDSRRDIAAAANHALVRHGFAAQPTAHIEQFVGDGADTLLLRAAGLEPGDDRLPALRAAFLDYYSEHPVDFTVVLPGVTSALQALSDLPLGVCTNKSRRTTVLVLQALGLAERFRGVVAGDDLPEKKPDPAPVRRAAELLGAAPERVWMVGDGAQDIRAGRAAGAFTVGVRGGIQGTERMLAAEPHVTVDSLAELPRLLGR